MTKKIIGGIKDDNGIFTLKTQDKEPDSIAIDDLLYTGLRSIRKALIDINAEVNMGTPSRETIQNLKDLIGMLRDLKKDEKDVLDNLTDEQLEQLLQSRQK